MVRQKSKPPFIASDVDFSVATNTIILSDIHLTTAEEVNPKDPLWRRFKQREFFIDDAFKIFLEKLHAQHGAEPIELILAGDIFDFDGVTTLPTKHRFIVTYLEKKRGLHAEERKSRFKMRCILQDHPVFMKALSEFVKKGHRVVFIIGNHDLELHWDSVKQLLVEALELDVNQQQNIRFTNWFYLSNKDTLIEHGNQHDCHSNCQNPVNPIIRGFFKDRIRIPFSSLANRFMLNGMGYFNPHSDRSYLMSAKEYMKFFFQQLVRREPLLLWTWFWGAVATLIFTFKEGFTEEVKDPLAVEDQIEEIARLSNATPRMVRELKEVHARPYFTDPLGLMRELWLDRAFLVLLAIILGFWVMSLLNVVWRLSYWWMFILAGAFLAPFFIFYFRSFKSKVIVPVEFYRRAVKLSSRITRVRRVVYGHTHVFGHTNFDGVEYLNSGTWSPAFVDIACTVPMCPKTFVWIRYDKSPENPSAKRVANVYEWKTGDGQMNLLC